MPTALLSCFHGSRLLRVPWIPCQELPGEKDSWFPQVAVNPGGRLGAYLPMRTWILAVCLLWNQGKFCPPFPSGLMKWRGPWSRTAATSWDTVGRRLVGVAGAPRIEDTGTEMRSWEGSEGKLLARGLNLHQEWQLVFPPGLGTEQNPFPDRGAECGWP